MDEFGFPSKILIDGIDRLGKSSLIERIQQELGYYLVIHYDKPKLLGNYIETAIAIKRSNPEETDYVNELRSLSVNNLARRLYQEETNRGMFNLMKSEVPIIFDRTHLGELVYSPLYRNYQGEYVYEYEQDYIDSKPYSHEHDSRLILLTSSNTEMLVDDGLSFDPSKKNDEQNMFIEAFNNSKLLNKVIVDVHNGQGGYRPYEEIFQEAMYKSHK